MKKGNPLDKLKVSNIDTGNNAIPKNNQGKNGDISVGKIRGNPVFFVKMSGIWYATNLRKASQFLNEVTNNQSTYHKLGVPDYDSGWLSVPKPGTDYGDVENVITVRHGLNTQLVLTQVYVKGDTSANVGSDSDIWAMNPSLTASTARSLFVKLVNSQKIEISFGNNGVFNYDNYYNADAGDQRITDGYIRALIWRTGART